MSKDVLINAFVNETAIQSKKDGYDEGIRDALITIKSLLQHNDIRLKTKEFWAEYKNLQDEGKIKK